MSKRYQIDDHNIYFWKVLSGLEAHEKMIFLEFTFYNGSLYVCYQQTDIVEFTF
jgi:hypothetical protein